MILDFSGCPPGYTERLLEDHMEERRIIRDSNVIALLLDQPRMLYLLPFRLAPSTVAQAARDRGLKPNQMSYWVERFVEAGLLMPVEAEAYTEGKRRGQAYQTTAREFVLLPGEGYAAEEIVEQRYGRMWRRLQQAVGGDTDKVASRWALRVFLHEGRILTSHELPVELIGRDVIVPEGNALNLWMVGRYDRATLAELRAELEEVFVRYSRRTVKDNPDVPRSIFHIALVRDPGN